MLPDMKALEGLLKSLALHDDTPTYTHRERRTDPSNEHTTLGSSSGTPAERKVLPYYMPSQDTTGSRAAHVPAEGRPSYLDAEDVTPERAPVREEVAPIAVEPEPTLGERAMRIGGPSVVAALLVLSVFIGGASVGAMNVGEARNQAFKTSRTLVASVERSAPALVAMQQAGVDAEPLRQAWFATNDAAAADKPELALIYARRVHAARSGLPVEADNSLILDDLDRALQAREQAYEAWADAASAPLGSLGVAFGLAQPPP